MMEIDHLLIALISIGILILIISFMFYKVIKLSKRNKELYILSKKQHRGISSSNELIAFLKSENQTLKDRIDLLRKEDKNS